jgi:hypothetical protein
MEEKKKIEIKIRKLEKLETTAEVYNNRSFGYRGTGNIYTS